MDFSGTSGIVICAIFGLLNAIHFITFRLIGIIRSSFLTEYPLKPKNHSRGNLEAGKSTLHYINERGGVKGNRILNWPLHPVLDIKPYSQTHCCKVNNSPNHKEPDSMIGKELFCSEVIFSLTVSIENKQRIREPHENQIGHKE